jgi:hypothetical protein
MIFLKSLAGGVGAVCLTWAIIVAISMIRINLIRKRQHLTGLVAVAGGWTELLHSPFVVIVITMAFGAGLYLTARFVQ